MCVSRVYCPQLILHTRQIGIIFLVHADRRPRTSILEYIFQTQERNKYRRPLLLFCPSVFIYFYYYYYLENTLRQRAQGN